MNKQEPYPITPAMMYIASHPTHAWLEEHVHPRTTKTNKRGEPELIVDSKDAFIKHLASKVRV